MLPHAPCVWLCWAMLAAASAIGAGQEEAEFYALNKKGSLHRSSPVASSTTPPNRSFGRPLC
jgi:hypothetical protein